MTIVSQNYNNLITNLITNEIFKATTNIKVNSINNIFNYINLIKSFDEIVNKSIILAIQSYITELDSHYTNSIERKMKYHIKDYCSRTILTIFGEITIKRHFFKSKLNGKSFCYVDNNWVLKSSNILTPIFVLLLLKKLL